MKPKFIAFGCNPLLQSAIESIVTKERGITITEMNKENNRYYNLNPLPPIKDNLIIINKPQSKYHK